MNVSERLINRLKRESNLFFNRAVVRRLEKEISRKAVALPGSPVIIFNASTRLSGLSQNAGFSLVISLALRAAGIPVIHLVCRRGLSRCVLGTNREDARIPPPCPECLRTSRFLYSGAQVHNFSYFENNSIMRQVQGLSLPELLAFISDEIPVGELILPSLRWILRRHHLVDDDNTRLIAREYILSACHLKNEIVELIKQHHPRAVVVFNGLFYPEAVFKWLARREGIPVYTHEVGMLPFSAFLTDQEATAYLMNIDESFQLTPQQEKRLDDYLAERMEGRFITAGIRFWPEISQPDEAFLQQVGQFDYLVPIFTNVIFDTSQGHANVLYNHMFEWLDSILPAIRERTDTLFVIRAHPDELREGKESCETVAEWVKERSVDKLPNVRFIPSDQFISSYDLIERSKFVMVYNSTIGLEASIMGKAVLCAGKARYTQIPTVYFPADSRIEYNRLLAEFLDARQVKHPENFQRNARHMLFCQLFAASLPFDESLEDDGVWRGYVRLKDLHFNQLTKDNSPTLRAVLDGILQGKPFIMEK